MCTDVAFSKISRRQNCYEVIDLYRPYVFRTCNPKRPKIRAGPRLGLFQVKAAMLPLKETGKGAHVRMYMVQEEVVEEEEDTE